MDPVHVAVNLFHRFFFSKIILKILENPITPQFCKNTPELFQNYILVPAILHLGACLTFNNYNYVLFLINLLILITNLIY
jgi:hypothetical protein